MNYYYDIYLNFQEEYFMFYEWDEKDNLEYIKKIPLYHLETSKIIDMLTKVFKVNNDFLKQIENKTKLKQNKYLNYACLVSDGKNNLALEFQSDGKVINKSSLLLEDELNINEFIYGISVSNIDYEIIKDERIKKESRQEEKIKKVLKLEIEKMYNNKEYSKLKYIYLEWFKEVLDSIDKMYNNMLDKLNSSLTEVEYHIYELIKLSYNNV